MVERCPACTGTLTSNPALQEEEEEGEGRKNTKFAHIHSAQQTLWVHFTHDHDRQVKGSVLPIGPRTGAGLDYSQSTADIHGNRMIGCQLYMNVNIFPLST